MLTAQAGDINSELVECLFISASLILYLNIYYENSHINTPIF